MSEGKNIFIFDIETIPDADSALNLIDSNLKTVEEKREALVNYHLDITDGKNAFLRQPFHQVVCISYVQAEFKHQDGEVYISTKNIRSGKGDTEKDLVEGFFTAVNKLKPILVSYNGKNFDLPVLMYRGMKYGIDGEYLYKAGGKWDNYDRDKTWHCDLQDALPPYRNALKLNEIASVLGFPGKIGVDGSKVMPMYDEGKIKEIQYYCETDVLNTFLVYLRYLLHISKISKEGYNLSIDSLIDYIDKSNLKHLQDFKEAWEISCAGEFFL